MMQQKRNKNIRERGQAVLEVTLMMPWIFFLFVGVLDFGFYSYQAICVENAARVAAVQIATNFVGLSSVGCSIAVPEMKRLTNVANNGNPCTDGSTAVSSGTPMAVNVLKLDKNSNPKCADCDCTKVSPATCAAASSVQVAVTYQSPQMVSIPGLLTNQLQIRRLAEVRIIAP
jgi:Flp pilus assembly protein TadG